MAKMRRVVAVGYPHHVTQRGNFRRNVFLDDEDRETYLALLAKNASAAELEILGYCLMTNHVHLIVVPKKRDSMATTFRRVHGSYSQWLNIRLRRTGHARQSRPVSSDSNRFLSARALPRGRCHAFCGV
jgi:putative transposase